MVKKSRKTRRISFISTKRVTEPVKIDFITRAGERISFISTKKVTKPVKVTFYKRERKNEQERR